jgi:hypothetical protein
MPSYTYRDGGAVDRGGLGGRAAALRAAIALCGFIVQGELISTTRTRKLRGFCYGFEKLSAASTCINPDFLVHSISRGIGGLSHSRVAERAKCRDGAQFSFTINRLIYNSFETRLIPPGLRPSRKTNRHTHTHTQTQWKMARTWWCSSSELEPERGGLDSFDNGLSVVHGLSFSPGLSVIRFALSLMSR